MQALYSISIFLFGTALRIGALFNPKAKRWTAGRKGLFRRMESDLASVPADRRKRTVWFHCASLGEFEQGRPVMEMIRERYPESFIVLTFFSPSGYEIRKETPVADRVWYLPLDTPANARRFVATLRPSMAFFVKYDYWFNMMQELHRNGMPLFVVSAVFRPGQLFFRWYGGWFLAQLRKVTWIFLQNGESKPPLERCGIKQFTVTGDTRFDRVAAIASDPKPFPLVEKFCSGSKVLVCGSTWPADEALILPLIVNRKIRLKYIIAPHEVHETRIHELVASIRNTPGMPVGQHAIVRLSELNRGNALKARILVVDSIGQLAHLYNYASFAFIGGGFGTGLHNILEAVTFGKPVMFGPDYKRFGEAVDLVRLGGAVPVKDAAEARTVVRRLLADVVHYQHMSDICRIYAESNKGATRRILENIRTFGFLPRTFQPPA